MMLELYSIHLIADLYKFAPQTLDIINSISIVLYTETLQTSFANVLLSLQLTWFYIQCLNTLRPLSNQLQSKNVHS